MPNYRRGQYTHVKGYPRMSAGPLRDCLIHRLVAAALIGRELTKDESVHHADGNKLNCHWSNLVVMGQTDHGWVSARQAWYMREKDRKEKLEWDSYMKEVADTFTEEIAEAKMSGVEWPGPEDGSVRQGWENRSSNNSDGDR